MELLLLRFVRSLRAGDFNLYISCLDEMIPWFFAIDHGNYARWLPVHLQDMKCLYMTNPNIFDAFKNGQFVVSKTFRKFSSIPIDHAHEQNNKIVKCDGGAVGLLENSSELTRWMVSGPEIARLIQEFETYLPINKGQRAETKHHEQTKSLQDRFRKHVSKLTAEIEAMDNPFLDTGSELVNIETKDVAETVVIETIIKVLSVGKEKYAMFLKERLIDSSKPIDDTIHRNKLPLFSYKPKLISRNTTEIATLRNNVKLFSQLHIANQRRNGDVDNFFSHENTPVPPSLSKDGELRSGKKSDLIDCLVESVTISNVRPLVEGSVIEGAVLVNQIRPTGQKYFSEYFRNRLLPHLQNELKDVTRLDVVWDIYISDSLKATTRSKRGSGGRKVVGDKDTIASKVGFIFASR